MLTGAVAWTRSYLAKYRGLVRQAQVLPSPNHSFPFFSFCWRALITGTFKVAFTARNRIRNRRFTETARRKAYKDEAGSVGNAAVYCCYGAFCDANGDASVLQSKPRILGGQRGGTAVITRARDARSLMRHHLMAIGTLFLLELWTGVTICGT